MDGYNGGPRGGGRLCGGEECLGIMNITRVLVEIGCHHAEELIGNGGHGVPTNNAWLIVTGEPCMMGELIHHAGLSACHRRRRVHGRNADTWKPRVAQRTAGPKDPR